MSTFPYNFNINKTSSNHLTNFYSINCLADYRAYIMDKYESIYEFSKQSKFFHKFNNFEFYSVYIALEGFVLVW